jgi:tripeptide aminopeptidase
VNAVKLAARYLERLPHDSLSPETTEDRAGFVHPDQVEGSTREVRIVFIARDHDRARWEEHEALLRRLADELQAEEPRAQVRVDQRQQYLNMKETLQHRPEIVEAAVEAMRREGIEARRTIIRGGTDGARLTELGLPTPNLFTGGRDYHSEREWLCVQDMGAACATIVHLVQVWAERGGAEG